MSNYAIIEKIMQQTKENEIAIERRRAEDFRKRSLEMLGPIADILSQVPDITGKLKPLATMELVDVYWGFGHPWKDKCFKVKIAGHNYFYIVQNSYDNLMFYYNTVYNELGDVLIATKINKKNLWQKILGLGFCSLVVLYFIFHGKL